MIIADLYCRVSTAEQAQHGYSIGEQEERLRKIAEANGWVINACYVDAGFTGANLNRPGVQKLIEDVKRKAVNLVAVYKLDRLSRSQKDTLFIIEDIIIKNGCAFYSMSEKIDTTSSLGLAMLGVLSCFSQLEKATITERMQLGRDARAKAGKYRGGANIPIGYRYNNGTLSVDDYEAAIIRDMYSRFLRGESCSSIATALNRDYSFRVQNYTACKVKRILTQPLYIGLQRWKGEIYPVADCPTIITVEQWEAAQREIKRRESKTVAPPQGGIALLTGKLFCGCCGARYGSISSGSKRRGKRDVRYYCYSRINANHSRKAPTCNNRGWTEAELNAVIIGEVKKLHFTGVAPMPAAEDGAKAIKQRIKAIDKQIDRLIDLYASTRVNSEKITAKLNALQAERDTAAAELENIKKPTGEINPDELNAALSNFSELLNSLSDTAIELRPVINQLIKGITLNGDTVTIQWAFE